MRLFRTLPSAGWISMAVALAVIGSVTVWACFMMKHTPQAMIVAAAALYAVARIISLAYVPERSLSRKLGAFLENQFSALFKK